MPTRKFKMKLDLKAPSFEAIKKSLREDNKQASFAVVQAMNESIKGAKNHALQRMESDLDRPTPFIKRAFRIEFAKRASRSKGTAAKHSVAISIKDVFGKNGQAAINSLLPQIEGGRRKAKGSELTLRRAGILATDEYIVPSRTARLDRFGNVRKGTMNRILADLSAHRSAGYQANRAYDASRQYIFADLGHMKGIFKVKGGFRSGGAKRNVGQVGRKQWSLVFLVVKGAPSYKKIYPFYEVAERYFIDNFDDSFTIHFKKALRTKLSI